MCHRLLLQLSSAASLQQKLDKIFDLAEHVCRQLAQLGFERLSGMWVYTSREEGARRF